VTTLGVKGFGHYAISLEKFRLWHGLQHAGKGVKGIRAGPAEGQPRQGQVGASGQRGFDDTLVERGKAFFNKVTGVVAVPAPCISRRLG